MIKLTLYDETNFNIRWFSMDVRRDKPGGMNGDNTDFAAVKIYSGDPLCARPPVTWASTTR